MQYDNQKPQGNTPKFGIMQMKRIALASLSGRWGEAMPATLIYGLIMIVPSFVSGILNLSSYRSLMTMLESGSAASFNQNYLNSLQTMQPSVGADIFSSLSFIITIFLAGAITIGFSILSLKILRREPISTRTIFEGFKNYGQSISLYILYTLLCLAISMILIIPSIIFFVGVIMQSSSAAIIGLIAMIAATVAIVILILRLEMSFFIAADNRNISAGEALKKSAGMMAGNKGRCFLLQLSFIGWILLVALPSYVGILMILFSGINGVSTSLSVVGAILTVISIVAMCPLTLYMQTTLAVFYSNISGNFSTAAAQTSIPAGTALADEKEAASLDRQAVSNVNSLEASSGTEASQSSFTAENTASTEDSSAETLTDAEDKGPEIR